jgi:L-aspartate semialdehyde sulfurtransferase
VGHSEPPQKMSLMVFNGVEAHGGVAAVDAYLGATQEARGNPGYGGAHVIEDLLAGREVVLRAVSRGTDCYPRKRLFTRIALEDLNFAVLCNPRNGYQRYNAATNSGPRTLRTYMGRLLPNLAGVTYSGAGELSPLQNDPSYRTIGIGTRILLGGGEGYVTGPGSQHNPAAGFGTLMVQGDLRGMSTDFLRAACFQGYGVTLYVGLGIPIPILDEQMAASTGIADGDIVTGLLDYGVPSRERPLLRTVTYQELRSGEIEVNGRLAKTSSLSSQRGARRVADELRRQIEQGGFLLTQAVAPLPTQAQVRPLTVRPPRREK